MTLRRVKVETTTESQRTLRTRIQKIGTTTGVRRNTTKVKNQHMGVKEAKEETVGDQEEVKGT